MTPVSISSPAACQAPASQSFTFAERSKLWEIVPQDSVIRLCPVCLENPTSKSCCMDLFHNVCTSCEPRLTQCPDCRAGKPHPIVRKALDYNLTRFLNLSRVKCLDCNEWQEGYREIRQHAMGCSVKPTCILPCSPAPPSGHCSEQESKIITEELVRQFFATGKPNIYLSYRKVGEQLGLLPQELATENAFSSSEERFRKILLLWLTGRGGGHLRPATLASLQLACMKAGLDESFCAGLTWGKL